MNDQFDFVNCFEPAQNDAVNYAISSALLKVFSVLGDLQELQVILNNAVHQNEINGIQGNIDGINASLGDFIEQTDADLDALKTQIDAVDAKIPPIVEDVNTLTSEMTASEIKISEILAQLAGMPDFSEYFDFLNDKTVSKKPFDVTGTATAGTLKSANLTSPNNKVTCDKIFNAVDSINVDNSGGYARFGIREGTNPYTESNWTCFGCAIGSGTYAYDPALYTRGQKRRIQTATNAWT